MGYFKDLLIEAESLDLPMSIDEASVSMADRWPEIAPDCFIGSNGRFDSSLTFQASDVRDMVVDNWISATPDNYEFFNRLLSNRKFQPIWDYIKRQAFPEGEIYGW